MSEFDARVRYIWDTEHQRYAGYRQGDNNLWTFERWMDVGWQPPLLPSAATAYSSGSSRPDQTPNTHGNTNYHEVLNQPASKPGYQRLPYGGPGTLSEPHHPSFGDSRYRSEPLLRNHNSSVHHGEQLDHSKAYPITIVFRAWLNTRQGYYVRDRNFFGEGKVFAFVMTENAGSTSATNRHTYAMDTVKYRDNYVHTSSRRFVVVQPRKEFCYACPILTYSGRATTKRGVRPSEHGIAYSVGTTPELLPGEIDISKPSVSVEMAPGEPCLHVASRIYYGIMHPIQYNVKVKHVGSVSRESIPILIGNWWAEQMGEFTRSWNMMTQVREVLKQEKDEDHDEDMEMDDKQGENMEANVDTFRSMRIKVMEDPPASAVLEVASNPRAFFKKGRVFTTLWAEPKGFSDNTFVEMARFAVVKPGPTFSVCLRISTYSGQATTKAGVASRDHAAVIPLVGTFVPHPQGEQLDKEPIEVKVENLEITIDPMSRINFAKPYTVEHNVKICNIGRVVGASVGFVDHYFAESLGLIKP